MAASTERMRRREKRGQGTVDLAAQRLLAEALAQHRLGHLAQAATLYRRLLAREPRHADACHLLGVAELGMGRAAEALASIDSAIAANDKLAAFRISRSAALLSLGRYDEAAQSIDIALRLDGNNAEAHNVMGNILVAQGQPQAAVACYEQALALRPAYAEAQNNLGSGLRAIGRLDDAERALRAALDLRPTYPSALANLGLVLQEQARYAEALVAYERAIAADANHAAAHGNRAMLQLLLGRLEEGFAEYEWRWRMPGFATPSRTFAAPAWDGSDPAGRTIFVHAEQGLGSAIQFARYASLLAMRGARVILECRRPLQRLFEQSLVGENGIARVVAKSDDVSSFDCHVPLMSLPHRLGTSLCTVPRAVPYLRANTDDVRYWHQRLEACARPLIGLVWAGNPRHENDHNRSMPASELATLAAATSATYVSLQVPAAPNQLSAFAPGTILDFQTELGDFAQTAALIANLDLVISVDTAAAHLAGAMDRPVWILLPFVPEWRWLLAREDSPWYASARLIRQSAPGDWAELTARVTQRVRSTFGSEGR
ncbi:MAG: tetratricopeptide repeat protein [Rhodospirillales bacterium]|nr:tetratricopeptide repeat protein [Rhodospirillales bacterium]